MPPALRSLLKRLALALGGARAFAWLGAKCAWGGTLLNYALMRLSLRGRLFRAEAWPHSLYIEGTNICNAACVFCAYPDMKRAKKVMPLELFRSAVDQYAALGGAEVDLTPIVGDPFADAHLFERLDYALARPGIRRVHFFTNAIAMRPELHGRLLACGERLRVYISFGGFDRETYRRVFGVDRFEAAAGNMRALIAEKARSGARLGIQVNLRCPSENRHGELWEYLSGMLNRGVIDMTWMSQYDSWAGQIKDSELAEAGLAPRPMPVKRGPCHRLLTSPVVLVDGRVNACACRDVEAELIIGDLKSQPLGDVLASDALRELVEKHDRGDFPDVCRRCTYYDSLYPDWMRGRLFPLVSRLFR